MNNRVSAGELIISCLLLASLITSSLYTAAYSTKRVDLVQYANYGFPYSKLPSMEELLKREHARIAFLTAKLDSDQNMQSSSTHTPLYSGHILDTVNYIINVGLGTPPHDLYLAIDTGSDLAWTQCLPCDACYEQHDPIFDPAASSSYKQVPCASAQCAQLGYLWSGACSKTNATDCDYVINYLDSSSTTGDFALDTLVVGGDTVSAAYPFGCGHQNQGLFKGLDGILGLSRDGLAFPAQTKAAFGEIFAYCMPNIFSSSAGYIEFGAAASAGGEGKGGGSTALVARNVTSAYVVEVEDIKVEGTRTRKSKSKSKSQSQSQSQSKLKLMLVDSGTVITRLDRALYEEVRDAFKEAASDERMKEAPQGAGLGLFEACYSSVPNMELFPSITFTFMGGLAFTPSAQNSVFPIDDNGTFCLALLPLDGFSILGNYHQQGRLFTFDIPHSSLSISSHAC